MLVSELINLLNGIDMPGARVILMSDPEGNSVWDVDEIDSCGFDKNEGETFSLEDYDVDEDGDDEIVVTIWPKHVERG